MSLSRRSKCPPQRCKRLDRHNHKAAEENKRSQLALILLPHIKLFFAGVIFGAAIKLLIDLLK